ncbi:ribosomal protein S18-alanine N-acetyltransferase [Spongiibacter sp. UBA1325]|uniref:ribosomal protein S18-alanine N-acetyltransferase n=1 Tax=Spongiibacter TaxID=630749 RepID=UPI00257D088A|nr:ribosomal protein S18-alanine N-acetyltransferase [Spongiibacter sp. UBA1325]
MSKTLDFVELRSVDLPACLMLSRHSDPYPWRDENWRRSLRDDYCFALREGSGLIAIAAFSLVLDELSLLNIIVSDKQRGRGLGRQLLCDGLEWMQQIGAQRCFLEVRESNVPARALYRALGFTEDGIRKNYYPSANGREDAILMSTPLPLYTG